MASLRERLSGLRKDVARGQGYFFPYPEVEGLITPEEIRYSLSQLPTLRGSERDIFRFTSLVRETSLKVFAILASNRDEAHILDFLYRRETDSKLPYTVEGLYFLPIAVARSFTERQSQFDPIVLEKGVIHRTLRPKDVLPFLNEVEKGEGGFGKVWKVEIDPSCQKLLSGFDEESKAVSDRTAALADITGECKQGVIIARKALHCSGDGGNERQILDLLNTLNHPNIVEFLGSYTQNDVHNLLFPYIEMDLEEYLLVPPSIDSSQVYAGMYGLADALSKIHNFTYQDGNINISQIGCHHDLRPANILVKDNNFMITDFGLSRLRADDKDSKSRLRGGHDDYLGPEAFNEEDWTNGVVGRSLDVWALGCIFAELASYLEHRSVQEFKATREATHGSSIPMTDCAFHLGGKLRPSVSQWLSELETSSQDQNMSPLIVLIRQMLNPNRYARIDTPALASQSYRLACQSTMDEIDQRYADLSFNGQDRKADIHILILLEHKRYIVWRSAIEHSSYTLDDRVLPNLGNLRHVLISADVSGSRFSPSESESLLRDLCTAIDSLCCVLRSEDREKTDILWTQKVCEIQDMESLAAIRAAPKPERYKSVGINAAMKYMALAISRSIRMGGRSRCIDAACVDVDQRSSTASLDMGGTTLIEDRSRAMGHYTGENGKVRVMIEWKDYDVRWQDKSGAELFEAMDTLVNLLDPEVTPREGVTKDRVLNCVGYFHEHHNHRFGFVYHLSAFQDSEHPTNVLLYSVNNVIRMTDPDSEKPETIRPDLGAIFYLAKDLASCLLAFHSAGWYHKNLSSHQVLIFATTPEIVHEHVASAVLAGFNDSRPEASGVTLGPKQELQHYYHPIYLVGTTFRHSFDYYSLGIVLLELGLWCPISIIRDDHHDIISREEFRLKLLKSYVPQLGEKMGSLYRNAVHFCLDAEHQIQVLQEKTGTAQSTHNLFRENVVEPLSLCYA